MSDSQSKDKTRISMFLFASIGLFALTVFMLGQSHNVFSRKAMLNTTFDNVGGLVVGSAVRLAGVDVGIVHKIEFFADDHHVERVRVVLAVERSALTHVRKDSVAQLTSKGLLGDMLINITIGSLDLPGLNAGDFITPQPVVGLGQVVDTVQAAVGKIGELTTAVNERVQAALTPEAAKDFGRIMHSAAAIVEGVERGNGLLHAVVYDQTLATDTEETLAKARETMTTVQAAALHLEKALAEVQSGDGMLHALIYGKEGAKTVHELAQAAQGLDAAIEQIRSGNGLLHSLIYEKDATNLMQDLSAAAKIVRNIASEVNEGKGTVGGLLKDPTVYQDLKTILGNIKRNTILKSVIRMSIEKDDLKHTGDIKGD